MPPPHWRPGAVRSEVANNAALDIDRYRVPESLYRAVADQIVRRAGASQRHPTPVDGFARQLADALVRPRPPRVVRLGRGVGFLPLLTRLPGRVRDRR